MPRQITPPLADSELLPIAMAEAREARAALQRIAREADAVLEQSALDARAAVLGAIVRIRAEALAALAGEQVRVLEVRSEQYEGHGADLED